MRLGVWKLGSRTLASQTANHACNMMKIRYHIWALAFMLLWPAQMNAQDLLLTNAQIVDPASETVNTGVLVIKEGRIAEVLEAPPAEFQGEQIDLAGKWVIPGLNDMHTHSYGNMGPTQTSGDFVMTPVVAKRMLYAGVTGFLDLFSPEDYIFQLRTQKQNGEIPGADIYAAGPILTATGGHGTEYGVPTRTIDSPEEAKTQVDELAAAKPDVVKIVYDRAGWMPTINKETMEAAIEASNAHGIPVVAHIGSWDDVRDVVEAGTKAITHTPRGSMPEDISALMKSNGVYMIPTLAVQSEFKQLVDNPTLLDNELLAAVAPSALIDAYRDTSAYDPRFKGFLTWQSGMRADIFASVGHLAEAGVSVLAGTDGGNPGVFQGYSVHRELELLVEAGLSEWQALASATTLAGGLIGQSFGVQAGDVANLVVLDASPIDDIKNTQAISMVVHHGAVVDRGGLVDVPNDAKPASVVAFDGPVIDDFSKPDLVSTAGATWTALTDKVMSGSSTLTHATEDGVLKVEGVVTPLTGRPGFASLTLTLNETGNPIDVSHFDGIEIHAHVKEGGVGLQLMTPAISNFDYHGKILMANDDMQKIRIPFSDFKQQWSAQMPWTGEDVFAVAFMVSGFQEMRFAYEIDSIGFYKD